MEFTGFPDLKPSDEPPRRKRRSRVPRRGPGPTVAPTATPKDPTVDVTMRLTEGKQYFVNRIVFTGNTTTRDNVIRREMRLLEGNVFNTESLKYSVRRLNQLGYFEQINEQDQNAMKVDKTPGRDNAVDVTLTLKEQNRNQLTFGAGVSQYEGFFGQLAFQTANFLGRGESLTVSMQAGDRAQNYQLAFTEPFLFDRNITGGFDIYKRALQYIGYYTQKSTGGNLVFGFPMADFSRMFINYSYEQVRMTDLNARSSIRSAILTDRGARHRSSKPERSVRETLRRKPILYDSCSSEENGGAPSAKSSRALHNTSTTDLPEPGQALDSLRSNWAMLGGNTSFTSAARGNLVPGHLQRTSFGRALQTEYIAPVAGTNTLPNFREAVHGRRVQRARFRHPLDWPLGSANGTRARRQQEPAVQRRVPDFDREPGPADSLLRRRPGG